MTRDGVGQARAQHDELMLPLALRSPHRPPHGVEEAAELALGTAIHIAHASHHGMGLVVQIQAIGDQFFELDVLRGAVKRTETAGPPTFAAIGTPALAATSVTASIGAAIWSTGPVMLPALSTRLSAI